MIIKRLYRAYLKRFKPLKYMSKVGIDYPPGGVHIYGFVNWSSEPWLIKLGHNVHITDGVKFLTHDGGTLLFRHEYNDLEITKPIVIGDNVYIGNNAVILPGVHVGDNVIIGACSVVTKDIPSNVVVAGVPAKIIKTIDEYLDKIKNESIHLGNLEGKEKDNALKKYYGYKGKSKGIYF